MKITSDKQKIIKFINKEKKLGFVPTMGAIHKGHISLIQKSISQCNKTVVSIFINKPQFNKKSDFINYPRNLKKDVEIIKKLKIDFLYLPKNKDIYPDGPNKKIKIHPFEKKLCGKFRPNHFRGVVDVIERFIKILNPKKIYLGEKDMQQLKIVENYVKKKYSYIKIISCKTIRNKSGLAYSSRNSLLTINEKVIASKIYNILYKNKSLIIKNKLSLNTIKKKILNLGVKKIDYIQILNICKIFKISKKTNKKIFIAYYLRKTRLIDNI
tara:strand:+ start:241 stop:1047 length:807 start_codon:yes stop_codon:yes gene_type:complete